MLNSLNKTADSVARICAAVLSVLAKFAYRNYLHEHPEEAGQLEDAIADEAGAERD